MSKSIAYLTSLYGRAGDTFIRREVEELRRRGWTVHTFSVRRADEPALSEEIGRAQRTTDYILDRGLRTLAMSFLRMSLRSPRRMLDTITQARALRWAGSKSAVWHCIYLVEASYLAEQLLNRRVTLLHNHISMNSGTVAMLASTLSGVPFSMTVHGPHDFLAAEHWALGKKISSSVMTVCISSFAKSQCMLFTPPEHWHKLHVVRCGIDGLFLSSIESTPPAPRTFVSIGRLSPEKGHLLLLGAAAVLRDLGMPPEIVIVGDGPCRADLERNARHLGLDSLVRFVGWQSSDDVRRLILQGRVVVQPSFAEGIPVVLMEAMALRRPVIATYVGGIPELVRPGENGWLVPAGSAERLASAMREALLVSDEDIIRMGERGRHLVLESHNVCTEGDRLASLFERAIREQLGDPAISATPKHS